MRVNTLWKSLVCLQCRLNLFKFQHRLCKPRTQKYLFFAVSGSSIRCCIKPLFCERAVTEKNIESYIYAMEKLRIHNCSHNSHQKKQKTKHSIHTSEPPGSREDDKKWDRTVTFEQSSKKDINKILKLNVSVLDTYPDDIDQKRSTIVAVHGFPGSGHDFESLAATLYEKGIRLVAPTSLGMTDSPITYDLLSEIDFTTEGRTKTLQLILETMNIHRIDMLIGHSAGAWTMYKAGASWNNLGSLFGINPAGAVPNRSLRPFLFLKFIAAALLWSLGRLIIVPFMAHTYRMLGFRDVKTNGSGSHLVATQQYITHQGFSDVPTNAELIRKRQLPVLFTYALNDRIMESRICHNMAYHMLGIPVENTVTYTDDKTPNRDPLFVPEGWLARCLIFARGGHIVHVAHEKEIVQQIEDLLKYLATANNQSDWLLKEEDSV